MDDLIRRMLSNMQQVGTLLSKKELLFETSWRVFDENNTNIYYDFKPDGTLTYTINGNYEKGEWDIINHNSILIKVGSNKAHFKNLLFEKALIILDKTNINDELFILYDEDIIKDNDFIGYLEKIKVERKNNRDLTKEYLIGLFLLIFIIILLLTIYITTIIF